MATSGTPASGLSIHAHCGYYARNLRKCVRAEHDIATDTLQLPPGSRCEPALEDFKLCGREFLAAHLEAVQSQRCAESIEVARACTSNCEAAEMAVVACLSKRVLLRMSTSRLES
uniref:Uncharacterized protein n=1 Tax=Haptolina ericina TaxID=156174 RepID=A0A7S3AY31_9EUKA|mmetsp:Transcript_41992/g.94883  ORF Transcript_41992/g.94883 Transcript_41992/m.94883 type:complete len:115 (+) Transcript_41992:73-417(+)